MNPTKYKPENKERKIDFVTRIVVTENRPMTANDVVGCIDRRSMRKMNPLSIHANLSDAVSKYESLCKKRMMNNKGQMRVHYYPCSMDVVGEDIPIPSHTKKGGHTFEKAVEVAEKVLVDLGAMSPPPAKTEKPPQLKPTFMRHGRLITIREFRFTARELIDQLHELDVRLYEQVLDTISDGLGIYSQDGWFDNKHGDMCISEEVFE